jgi:thermostable 8-oxoguanine DNA glycosylase
MTDEVEELYHNIAELQSQLTEIIDLLEKIRKYSLTNNRDELEEILEKIKYFKENNYGSIIAKKR